MKQPSTNSGTNSTGEGGFGVLPAFIHRSPDLTCLEKCVLLDLSQYCGGGGMAWPRVSLLASHQGVSRATMHRALKRLYEMGLVKKTRRHRADGSRSSNIYQLRFDAWNKGKVSPVRRPCSTGETGSSTGETTPVSPVEHQEKEQEKNHLKVLVDPTFGGEKVFVDIWTRALETLAGNTSEEMYREYYAPLVLVDACDNAGFVIGCPSHLLASIESNHTGRIRHSIRRFADENGVSVALTFKAV